MKRLLQRVRAWHGTAPVNRAISVVISGVLILIMGLAVYQYFFEARRASYTRMVSQVAEVAHLLGNIDAACTILGFDLDKNYITFLNVHSFTGNAVGSLRLKSPEKWAGPYRTENPSIQDKYYYVLKTLKNEFYIVPGDGVVLANGKILGRDIRIESDTDIEALLKREPALWLQGRPLILSFKLRQMPLSSEQKIRLLGANELE